VKLNLLNGHAEASLGCDVALLPKERSWLLQNRAPQSFFQFRSLKRLGDQDRSCHQDSKSTNQPVPLARRETMTAPARATSKLQESSAPYQLCSYFIACCKSGRTRHIQKSRPTLSRKTREGWGARLCYEVSFPGFCAKMPARPSPPARSSRSWRCACCRVK